MNSKFDNRSSLMTENDFKSFLQSKDFIDMSVDKLNFYFNGLYEFIMKDAVYPHLTLKNV